MAPSVKCPPAALMALAALSAALTFVASAQSEPYVRPPAPVKFTGGPLTCSVQNESNAAIDRACAWLASRQNAAGFWGDADPGLTAVCALALAGAGEELLPDERATVDRAVAWLLSPQATNAISMALAATNATVAARLAWRDMALAVFSPETPPDNRFLAAPADAEGAGFALREAIILRDAVAMNASATNFFPAGTGDFCTDSQHALVAETSASAPHAAVLRDEARTAERRTFARLNEGRAITAAECWRFARCVNRSLGGEVALTDGGEVVSLPWRGRLANFWTTSQRIDDRGRGHWKDSVEETAFAVLLLKEL